jgi:hypothetical protein
MTSIPVPAPEAPPDEPSGTKIGAVVIAFALGTAVSIGLGRPPSTNERLRRVRRLHTPSGHGVNIAGFPAAPQRRRRWPQSCWPWPSSRP